MIEKRTQWYHPIQIFDLHAENWVIHRNVDVLWLPDCSYLCCSPLWQFTLDVSTIIFPMITHKHTHTHLFNGKSDQYVRFNARRSFIEQLYFQMNKICAKWCGGLLAIYNLPKRQLRVHWITFGMHVLRVHFNHFRLQIYFNSLFFSLLLLLALKFVCQIQRANTPMLCSLSTSRHFTKWNRFEQWKLC